MYFFLFVVVNKKKRVRKTPVYLDHAATTPLDLQVFRTMRPFFSDGCANPSALYGAAVAAREAIERARAVVAEFLHTQPETIVFTRGGTESCNLALLGLARAYTRTQTHSGRHIITSSIEHHAVLEPIRALEKDGWSVTYLPVDAHGLVSVSAVQKALRPDTAIVSIMYANNEIGSIQPVAEIGKVILQWRKTHKTQIPFFHTDACQAAGYLAMNVEQLHADLLSFNGSKIYGPQGAGALYVRRGAPVEPLVYGGGQEVGLRSGTEDVATVVGLGKAVEIVMKELESREDVRLLRDYLWREIHTRIPDAVLNGPALNSPHRLPNNLHVSFLGCDAEALILYLDAAGVSVSAGAACGAQRDESSHVLAACGIASERARSSIRFTLGRTTTRSEIRRVASVLPPLVERVRAMGRIS